LTRLKLLSRELFPAYFLIKKRPPKSTSPRSLRIKGGEEERIKGGEGEKGIRGRRRRGGGERRHASASEWSGR
jgi:hypothetical protein